MYIYILPGFKTYSLMRPKTALHLSIAFYLHLKLRLYDKFNVAIKQCI